MTDNLKDLFKEKYQLQQEQMEIEYRNAVEMQKTMPKDQVQEFLHDYRPFVKKFFGDLSVKTIRYNDERKQFYQKEISCAQSWYELYNTVDRFYCQENYFDCDNDPSFRVWVEKQNTLAIIEGY